MGSQLIQGQWSLNESSNSIYGLARGVLQAATSDNVQPLAILACEQFGNTLAISQETRLKIERTVLPTPEPVSLQFLKVKIGFLKHDCAVQLGSNQAGLRFLALAAALISSLPPFGCAHALTRMLEATTTNKQYLPTTRQLTDLMSSLEGRCRLAGFADVVYGYHSIITGVERERGLWVPDSMPKVPDSKGLETLVDVFRQIQRVGEHEIESVVVEACASAAWIAAFSKWSLETPPSIYLADGTPITPQSTSKVTIIVTGWDNFKYLSENEMAMKEGAMKVTKRFKVESLQDLITENSSSPSLSYRINFETFSAQIQDICGRHEWARNAIFAAVPLAIRLILEQFSSAGGPKVGSTRPVDPGHSEGRLSIRPFIGTRPSPFPEIEKVFSTMSLVLGLPSDFPSEMLASAKSFRDLEAVENYFDRASELGRSAFSSAFKGLGTYSWGEVLETPCWVKDDSIRTSPPCREKRNTTHEISSNSPKNLARHESSQHELIGALGFICHMILLVSLFDNPNNVLFIPPRHYWTTYAESSRQDDEWCHKEVDVLAHGACSENNVYASKVFLTVCKLLHHDRGDKRSPRVLVKSGHSDCFWFSALENPLFSASGYLSLSSCRGRIMHGRELYTEIYDQPLGSSDNFPEVKSYTLQSVTHNPFAKFRFQWQMDINEANLSAGLSVANGEDTEAVYQSYPFFVVLDTLAHIRVVNCEHPVEKSLDQSKAKSRTVFQNILRPQDDRLRDARSYSKPHLIVYPMGRNTGLQMYCLGLIRYSEVDTRWKLRVALRQNACFDCCVKACKKYNCQHLIL